MRSRRHGLHNTCRITDTEFQSFSIVLRPMNLLCVMSSCFVFIKLNATCLPVVAESLVYSAGATQDLQNRNVSTEHCHNFREINST